jgi:uncharacterized protein (DUF2141 family)
MNKKSIFTSVVTIVAIFASGIVLFSKPTEKSANINSKGNIIVEMTNFANNEGIVLVGIYKDFPESSENMIMSMKSEIKDKKVKVEFKDVPYGVYAISGFHDENKDGKLAKGMFGIPKEGIVTSNNAVGKMGPVKFEDAKFELKELSLKLEITVKYY